MIKTIVAEIKQKYTTNDEKRKKELDKLLKFVKNCNYFVGKRRELYKIIIEAKKK